MPEQTAVFPVSTIASHPWTHFDEALAIALLRGFGRERFPGIENAQVEFWGRAVPIEGRGLKEGVLCIGVGEGLFDEHQVNGRNAKACATTLVADYLGISKIGSPLNGLLSYALDVDSNPVASPYSLPTILKDVNLLYAESPSDVLEWATIALNCHIERMCSTTPAGTYCTENLLDVALADFLCQNASQIPGHHHK